MSSPLAPPRQIQTTGWWAILVVTGLGGIPSSVAFGNATLSLNRVLTMQGIPSSVAFGIPKVMFPQTVSTLGGIASSVALGVPKLHQSIGGAGIPSSVAFGTPTVSRGNVNVGFTGIASSVAVGDPLVDSGQVILGFTGIPSSVAFGTTKFTQVVGGFTGIPSSVAFGVATSVVPGAVNLGFTGLASSVFFGTPTLVPQQFLTMQGIASSVAFGTAKLNQSVGGAGIPSSVAFGSLTVVNPAPPQTLTFTGISSSVAFGTPNLWDGFDQFEDVTIGASPTTTEVGGYTWVHNVTAGVNRAEQVRDNGDGIKISDAPLAAGGETYYPEINTGSKIFKMGGEFRASTVGSRTGTGWAAGLITWADGGIGVNGPSSGIRTSGHVTFEYYRAVLYIRNTLNGTLTAILTWTFPVQIPDNTFVQAETEYDYTANTCKVSITIAGTTYTNTWNNANIVGYADEIYACWQGYYSGLSTSKRVEWRKRWFQRRPPPPAQTVSTLGGIASSVAFGTPTVGFAPPKTNVTDGFTGAITENFTNQGPNYVVVSSGIATADSAGTWNFALCNTSFQTKAQYIECTMTGAVNSTDVLILVVMGSSTIQPFAYLANGGSSTGIYTNPDGYGSIVGGDYDYTLRQSGSISWTTGDVIRFEVTGTGASKVFTVKKNGGSAIITWPDTGNVIPDTNVGGGFGYYLASAGARGVDFITVADT